MPDFNIAIFENVKILVFHTIGNYYRMIDVEFTYFFMYEKYNWLKLTLRSLIATIFFPPFMCSVLSYYLNLNSLIVFSFSSVLMLYSAFVSIVYRLHF